MEIISSLKKPPATHEDVQGRKLFKVNNLQNSSVTKVQYETSKMTPFIVSRCSELAVFLDNTDWHCALVSKLQTYELGK